VGCIGSDTDESDEEDDERLQLVVRGRKPVPQARSQAQASCRSTFSARSGSVSTSTNPGTGTGQKLLDLDLDIDLAKSDIIRPSVPRALLYHPRVEVSNFKLTAAGGCKLEWETDWASRWENVRNLSQGVTVL
jgi:hypothetical protein